MGGPPILYFARPYLRTLGPPVAFLLPFSVP